MGDLGVFGTAMLVAAGLLAPLAVSPLPVDRSHRILSDRSGYPGMHSVVSQSTGGHGVPAPTDPTP
jgi:hypothetical protein